MASWAATRSGCCRRRNERKVPLKLRFGPHITFWAHWRSKDLVVSKEVQALSIEFLPSYWASNCSRYLTEAGAKPVMRSGISHNNSSNAFDTEEFDDEIVSRICVK